MEIEIKDKVICITGAGRGLGKTFALGLAAEGAKVAVLAMRQEQADEVVGEIAELDGAPPALAVVADVRDDEQMRAAAAAIEQRWGRLDGLINNAAWLPPSTAVLDMESEALDRAFGSNVIGSFLATRYLTPLMARGGGGRIIFMSSAIGVRPNPGQAAYGGTKAAVNALSYVTHLELADQGIRTVALAPGLTDTPGMRESVGDEYIERVAQRYPGGRLGQPEDLIPLVAFLCSPLSMHLSGTVITVRPPA